LIPPLHFSKFGFRSKFDFRNQLLPANRAEFVPASEDTFMCGLRISLNCLFRLSAVISVQQRFQVNCPGRIRNAFLFHEQSCIPRFSVRVAAAEALIKYGNADDATRGPAALKTCADPTKTSAYAATLAMNTIDELGDKAASLHDFIRTMPTKDPRAYARADGYVARLQTYILGKGQLDSGDTPKKKRATKAGK
jgi:hypothetical protein